MRQISSSRPLRAKKGPSSPLLVFCAGNVGEILFPQGPEKSNDAAAVRFRLWRDP